MNFEDAMRGTMAPADIAGAIVLLDIPYIDFAGVEQVGQLLMHKDLAQEVQEIFGVLKASRFPIQQMVPIVAYNWDDVASMTANNCSAFNYRLIAGTDRMSNHATGRALDINPIQNPYFTSPGISSPPNLIYDTGAKGTVATDDIVVSTFKAYGWQWGGDWVRIKDYQHFEKL